MQFSKLLSVVVGLLTTAEAIRVQRPRIAARGKQQKYDLKLDTVHAAVTHSAAIQNMVIKQIVTRSAVDKSNGTTIYDDSISCMLIPVYLIQHPPSLHPIPSTYRAYTHTPNSKFQNKTNPLVRTSRTSTNKTNKSPSSTPTVVPLPPAMTISKAQPISLNSQPAGFPATTTAG